MKKGIHPDYQETIVTCTCGTSFKTRSTKFPKIMVEICSKCHPFFTGKQKLVDTTGQLERFQKKWGKLDVGQTSTLAPQNGSSTKSSQSSEHS